MKSYYDKIYNFKTKRYVKINSNAGKNILLDYINLIGGTNPNTRNKWSSYSCKLGDLGINNVPITSENCNKQISYNNLSRCKWSEKGQYCRKRQSRSRLRAQKHLQQAIQYGTNTAKQNIQKQKRSLKAKQHWQQAQQYGTNTAKQNIQKNRFSERNKTAEYAIAKKKYRPINNEPAYATFEKGDKIINIIDWKYPNWIYAEVERTGQKGWIPTNYLDIDIFSWAKKNIIPITKNLNKDDIPSSIKVKKSYKSSNNKSLNVKYGDKIVNIENWMFPKWIFGTSEKTGKKGWIPVDVLEKNIFKTKY